MRLEENVVWFDEGIGRIKVWLSEDPEETYLDAVIAYKDALVGWLSDPGGWIGMPNYVNSLRTKRPIIYLIFVSVREELGGRGIGSAMLSRVIEIAKEFRVKKILLQRDSNSRSSDEALARLYKRFGFRDIEIDNEDEDDPMPAMELSL
jgi:Acetyltransferases